MDIIQYNARHKCVGALDNLRLQAQGTPIVKYRGGSSNFGGLQQDGVVIEATAQRMCQYK